MKTHLVQTIDNDKWFADLVCRYLEKNKKAEVYFSTAISTTGQIFRTALFVTRVIK